MADIAKEARVGIATVDRVLNKRTPVKESTERKVLESARRLGFALEQSRYRLAADRPAVALRMGFILHSSHTRFTISWRRRWSRRRYRGIARRRPPLFCITILTPSTIWPPRSPV
jgi:hypothetical protein